MMKKIIWTGAIAALAFVFLAQAEATVLRKSSVQQLTAESDFVVMGKVVELRSYEVHGEIWTAATVIIEKSVKGNAHGSILLRIPGGVQTVNGKTVVTRVDGVPELNSLQRGVFFLNGKAPQYMDLAGWEQGFWHIESRPEGESVRSWDQRRYPLSSFIEHLERLTRERQ
jgi:hypothetical protein